MTPTITAVEARDAELAMIRAVISAYHTTRLAEVPPEIHVSAKPGFRRALAAYLEAAAPQPPETAGEDGPVELTEVAARDHLRKLIGSESALAWATRNSLTGQQVDSFLRGDRPLEPKLAAAMGLRRVSVYRHMENIDV